MPSCRSTVGGLLLVLLLSACGSGTTTVEFYLSEQHRFTQAERRAIEDVAEQAASEAKRFLSGLPAHLTIRVYAGADVIPETGETATAVQPSTVIWVVDAARPGGVGAVTRSWLRASLLHEFHHLVRGQSVASTSLMDDVVTEGMATVFEREVAEVVPPWGTYPDDADRWLAELDALPSDADRGLWLRGQHADGRRWVGMKVGTYLVDRATAASGKSAADLVMASTEEILQLGSSAGATAQ